MTTTRSLLSVTALAGMPVCLSRSHRVISPRGFAWSFSQVRWSGFPRAAGVLCASPGARTQSIPSTPTRHQRPMVSGRFRTTYSRPPVGGSCRGRTTLGLTCVVRARCTAANDGSAPSSMRTFGQLLWASTDEPATVKVASVYEPP